MEGVEMSLRQVLLPLLEGREGEKSDSLDLVRFVGHQGGAPKRSRCEGPMP
jgi:hypothetical protein